MHHTPAAPSQLAAGGGVVAQPGAELVKHLARLGLIEQLVVGAIPHVEDLVRAAGLVHQATRLCAR